MGCLRNIDKWLFVKQQFSSDIFVNCYTMYFLVMYGGYADCGVINWSYKHTLKRNDCFMTEKVLYRFLHSVCIYFFFFCFSEYILWNSCGVLLCKPCAFPFCFVHLWLVYKVSVDVTISDLSDNLTPVGSAWVWFNTWEKCWMCVWIGTPFVGPEVTRRNGHRFQ